MIQFLFLESSIVWAARNIVGVLVIMKHFIKQDVAGGNVLEKHAAYRVRRKRAEA